MSRLRMGKNKVKAKKSSAAVSATELAKAYGEIEALSPLDLEIEPGEAVVLIGHNGSGKSTLLAMIAGVLEPSDGELKIFGADRASMAARAAISYLPDAPVLYDDLSVAEHLEYVSRLHGGTGNEATLDGLLERLGLADRRDHLPSQFSRGLRQKTAIAVALCRPFGLLLVDEPFVGLDAAGRDAFLALLDEARDDGATLIVATHEPSILDRFDRCISLAGGELVSDGPPSQTTVGDLGG